MSPEDSLRSGRTALAPLPTARCVVLPPLPADTWRPTQRQPRRASTARFAFVSESTWSLKCAALVPGREEYGNTCASAKPTLCMTARVFSWSSSVSPGNPQITSVVIEAPGTRSFVPSTRHFRIRPPRNGGASWPTPRRCRSATACESEGPAVRHHASPTRRAALLSVPAAATTRPGGGECPCATGPGR